LILEIFFNDPDPDPWPKDPGSVGSGLKTHGSPTLVPIKENKNISCSNSDFFVAFFELIMV
jgi:hypothetical protein